MAGVVSFPEVKYGLTPPLIAKRKALITKVLLADEGRAAQSYHCVNTPEALARRLTFAARRALGERQCVLFSRRPPDKSGSALNENSKQPTKETNEWLQTLTLCCASLTSTVCLA